MRRVILTGLLLTAWSYSGQTRADSCDGEMRGFVKWWDTVRRYPVNDARLPLTARLLVYDGPTSVSLSPSHLLVQLKSDEIMVGASSIGSIRDLAALDKNTSPILEALELAIDRHRLVDRDRSGTVLLAIDQDVPAAAAVTVIGWLGGCGYRRAELLFTLSRSEQILPPTKLDKELTGSLEQRNAVTARTLTVCPPALSSFVELMQAPASGQTAAAVALARAVRSCGCRPDFLTLKKLSLAALPNRLPLSSVALELRPPLSGPELLVDNDEPWSRLGPRLLAQLAALKSQSPILTLKRSLPPPPPPPRKQP